MDFVFSFFFQILVVCCHPELMLSPSLTQAHEHVCAKGGCWAYVVTCYLDVNLKYMDIKIFVLSSD